MIRQKYFLVIVCKMSCYFSDAHSDASHVKIFTVPKCIQFKPLLCKINKTKMILVHTLKKKKKGNSSYLQNSSRLTDTERRLVVAKEEVGWEREGSGGWGEQMQTVPYRLEKQPGPTV